MKTTKRTKIRLGFTLIELLVLLAIVAIMFSMIPHMPSGSKEKARVIQCMSNLRQIGFGFIIWASDVGKDEFPWPYSTNSGGAAGFGASAAEQFLPLVNMGYFNTNSHSTRVFICPTDKSRIASTNFVTLNNSNLSYFVSLDASIKTTTNSTSQILSADRHLSVSGQPAKPGLLTVRDPLQMGWTRELHDKTKSSPKGVVVFVDGHAEQVTGKKLPDVFQKQTMSANRLLIP